MLAYKEIFRYLQSEEGLEKLLEEYVKVFDAVDEISDMMVEGVYEGGEQIKSALVRLSGLQGKLRLPTKVLEAEEINRKLRFYMEIRKANGFGENISSSAAEKEASAKVSKYREVRNIFLAYLETCESKITSCQSVLKHMTQELKVAKG